MATVSARLSVIGENAYGQDKEKDANTLLLELEKGLRSPKIGEQCEAIVRFPRLFEKYPFPIVINGALLKLADDFRIGNNFIRLCILRVIQQSEKHLDKIMNIEEFFRRLYSVIHSNDPVARALTLRVLGGIARVMPESKNVHHSIINGLESNDAVELEAAIYATASYTEQSKSFACGIHEKLADMIEGLATPVDMKLKLIPIFQYMYHDASTAQKVRSFCSDFLKMYPSRAFVMITLHTLSQLAAKSAVDTALQIQLLINYLVNDVRMAVKTQVLQDMLLLAKHGPHMWNSSQINDLVQFVMTTRYEGLQHGGLTVLVTLSSDIGVINFDYSDDSQITDCCSRFAYHSNVKLASKASQVLANLAIAAVRRGREPERSEELAMEAGTALEALIMVISVDYSKETLPSLKCGLRSVVSLCDTSPSQTDRFIDTIMTNLFKVDDDVAVLLCECLSAISSLQHDDLLKSLVPDIVQFLRLCSERPRLVLPLMTTLFQACIADGISEDVAINLKNTIATVDGWTAYRIGRQATRYGHHDLAMTIFKDLTTKVSSEHFNFWLNSLKEACLGECHFLGHQSSTITNFVHRVAKSEVHYHNSVAALKAATTPSNPLVFQTEYLGLRIQCLQAYIQVVRACCSFQTCPPPAIATSLAMTNGNDLHRFDHVIAQLKKCVQSMTQLSEKYKQLLTSSFDADPESLLNVDILQHSCKVMIHVLETILTQSRKAQNNEPIEIPAFEFPVQSSRIEHQPMILACQEVLKNLNFTCKLPTDTPITHQHISFIQNTSIKLCQVPMCFPRYFYQSVQSTELKLAVSPQSKAGDSLSVSYDTQLTLKVEGVIQHTGKRDMFRKVHKVCIKVHSSMLSKGPMVNDSKIQETPKNEMVEVVTSHNDFFTTQFLLTFPVAGQHCVNFTASVIHEDGTEWNTGPKTSVLVKSYDEAIQRQHQQQYAAMRQQQRAAASSHQH